MLSGIGPRATLEQFDIPVRVASEGVGRNLQDRYEVAVVNRMNFPTWKSLDGATFTRDDPQYKEWADHRKGVYASNGTVLSAIARSHPGAPSPDLYLYALLGMSSKRSRRSPSSIRSRDWSLRRRAIARSSIVTG